MSTTHRKTSRLLVAGVTGAVLTLAPAVAHADGAGSNGASGLPVTTPSISSTSERADRGTITAPRPGEVVRLGPVTFTGTGTPGTSVEVRLSGPEGPDSDSGIVSTPTVGPDGTWQARWTFTEPGVYTASVRNPDNTSGGRVQLRVAGAEETPLTFTSPTAGATVAPGATRITGTGTPGQTVDLWLQGPLPDTDAGQVDTPRVGADGTWSAETTILAPGTYRLSASSPGSDLVFRTFVVR